MTWFQLPLNVWAIYATAIMQVLATPVLGITLLLLSSSAFAHIGIFDPTLGGDPVLFQHFFWFYSHPAVYIMIVPAHGRDQRADLDVLAQADLRLPLHRVLVGLARAAVVPRLGPPHVRVGPVACSRTWCSRR